MDDSSSFYSGEVSIAATPTDLDVTIPTVAIEGSVEIGEEPLAAHLVFSQGRRASESVTLESDEDGMFFGALPRTGAWKVRVKASEPSIDRRITVTIPEAADGPAHRVRIKLPSTRISGQVVSEAGDPVTSATVVAVPEGEGPTSAITTERGKFEFLGLPPGSIGLVASGANEESSDWRSIDLVQGLQGPAVRLVLRRGQVVRGRVVSPDGMPVPGARIQWASLGEPVFLSNAQATDHLGRFEVLVPAKSDAVVLSVFAIGFSLRTLQIRSGEREEIVVPVDQLGGAIQFLLPHDLGWQDLFDKQLALFTEQGAVLGWSDLEGWSRANGETAFDGSVFMVPRLDGGQYRACILSLAQLVGLPSAEAGVPICRSGFLSPLGELQLDLRTGRD